MYFLTFTVKKLSEFILYVVVLQIFIRQRDKNYIRLTDFTFALFPGFFSFGTTMRGFLITRRSILKLGALSNATNNFGGI